MRAETTDNAAAAQADSGHIDKLQAAAYDREAPGAQKERANPAIASADQNVEQPPVAAPAKEAGREAEKPANPPAAEGERPAVVAPELGIEESPVQKPELPPGAAPPNAIDVTLKLDEEQRLIGRVLGPDSPEAVGKSVQQAMLFQSQGDMHKAEASFQSALTIAERTHSNQALVNVLTNFAQFKETSGDNKGATEMRARADLYSQRLTTARALAEMSPKSAALSVGDLAKAEGKAGNRAEAEKLFGVAVKSMEEAAGKDSKGLLPILTQEAEYLRSIGRVDFGLSDRIKHLQNSGVEDQELLLTGGTVRTVAPVPSNREAAPADAPTLAPALPADSPPLPPMNEQQPNQSAIPELSLVADEDQSGAPIPANDPATAPEKPPDLQEHYRQREQDLSQKLTAATEVFGAASIPAANLLCQMGDLYDNEGNRKLADSYFHSAVSIYRNFERAEPAKLAISLLRIAGNLEDTGLGPEHPQVQKLKVEEEILNAQDQFAMAISSGAKANYTTELLYLGDAYAHGNQYSEADAMYRESLHAYEKAKAMKGSVDGSVDVYGKYAQFLRDNHRDAEADHYQRLSEAEKNAQ